MMRRLLSLAIGAAAIGALSGGALAQAVVQRSGGGRYDWASPNAPGMAGQGGGWTTRRSTVQSGSIAGVPMHPRAGGWHAGGANWNHVRFRRGYVVPPFWRQPSFFVPNWGGYGFPAPGAGRTWIRHRDDALLVDDRGYVHDYRYDVDWDHYDHGPVPVYAPGEDADALFYEDDAVTWQGGRGMGPAPAAYTPQPYTLPYPMAGESRTYYVPHGATVTITPPVATTTTRTYVEEAPRRHRRR